MENQQAEIPSLLTTKSTELKERLGTHRLDALLVFGQGPVKKVMREGRDRLEDILDQKQLDLVKAGKKKIISEKEFLERLQTGEKLSHDDFIFVETVKDIYEGNPQELGRKALNIWSRMNALAAGELLFLGATDRVILSGGKTGGPSIPSEAELIKDVIVRGYGEKYKAKYGKDITDMIITEDKSSNTLENFAYVFNNYLDKQPENFQKVGVLGTDFHVERILILSKLYGLEVEKPYRGQELLKEKMQVRGKREFLQTLEDFTNPAKNPDLLRRIKDETRWTVGLSDPAFLPYWARYPFYLGNLRRIKGVIELWRSPIWREKANELLGQHGLNVDTFDPDKLSEELRSQLKAIPRHGVTPYTPQPEL